MKMTAAMTKLVRHTLLAAPLALAPAVSSVMMQTLGQNGFQSGVVFAQEKKEEKPKYKTRKTPALRESVYKKLAVVQELTNPEEKDKKPNFPEALKELKDIQEDSKKFNQYELAQLYNYFGFVYYSLENYKQAIKYYKLVIDQSPQIPEGLELGTLYTIAQLYFVLEDYRNAIVALDKWMAASPIVGADAYVLKAQGHYQLEQKEQSLKAVNKGIALYEEKGKVPKENWLSLQRALYYDKGDNKKVIEILEKLVRHYPKITYYKQLAGMYGAVNREKDQMHMLEATYLIGGLEKEKELLNLAYLLMGEEVPYKAAKIIDEGIKAKVIEDTSKNLDLLATAWRLAQEIDKSIPEMEKAAKKSENGDLYARLAGVYLDSDQNEKALDAGGKALKRGSIKRPDQLYIVTGMARANIGKFNDAIKDFKQAAKDKRSRRFAKQWIQFCESEIKRKRQLKL
ncbi:MAG: tetratricopeptide repeat protein [Exilibacterium sp.]